MTKFAISPLMKEAKDFFADFPEKWYFVGGCVRDAVLGLEPKDVDLFTPATPDVVEAFIRSKGRRVFKVGSKFGTLGVKLSGVVVEMTTFRKETYDLVGRKPNVVFTTDIVEDLQRRDFTINALVMTPDFEVRSPISQAREDITAGILRTVGNSKHRFHEDPLRILRGVRFAAKYDLQIENKTAERMESTRWEMLRLSKERIVEELFKMAALPADLEKLSDPLGRAFRLLWTLNHWQVIFPNMQFQHKFDQVNPHHKLFLHEHSIAVAKSASVAFAGTEDHALRVITGLFHDVAKPNTVTLHKSGTRNNYINHDILGAEIVDGWARQYKLSNHNREFIVNTIRQHLQDDCWLRPHDFAGKAAGAEATAAFLG